MLVAFMSLTLIACGSDSDVKAPDNTNGDLVVGEILISAPAFVPSLAGSGNEQLLTYWGFFENGKKLRIILRIGDK